MATVSWSNDSITFLAISNSLGVVNAHYSGYYTADSEYY